MTPNKLILSIEDNEEVKTALAKVSPGDVVMFEVTAKLDEATGEQAVFSVKSADIIDDTKPEPETDSEQASEVESETEDTGDMSAIFGAK
jgi:hypothetical protein